MIEPAKVSVVIETFLDRLVDRENKTGLVKCTTRRAAKASE